MAIRVVTPPAVEPVTLNEAKLHCRIDVTDDDALVTSLITVARQYCETFTGRAFVTQTIQYDLPRWPRRKAIYLPRPPLQSVTSVTWWDTDGNDTVLIAGTDYLVDAAPEPGTVLLPDGVLWPSEPLYAVHPVRIEYVAGYPQVAPVDHVGEAVGTGDGTETTFTLENTPIVSGSETIYVDGAPVLAADYTLDLTTGELVFATAPGAFAITADYTEAADLRANVPEYIKAAIKLLVGNWYENREQVLPAGHVGKELPLGVQALLWQERVFWTEEFNR